MTPPPKAARARALLGPAAACLALAIVATAPTLVTPTTRLVGHPDVDVANHAWGPWWWWSTLGRGQLPWRTGLLGAPEGGVLWFIDPFTAAVGAPFVGIIGPVGAYNLAILVSLALAAAGARALARACGAGPAASWIAAAAAVFSPYLLSEVHNGVSEAVGVGWSTFALAAARRAIDADGTPGGARRWVVTGAWLGVAAAGTWYYGLATGLTIGAWALLQGVGRPRGERLAALRGPVAGALLAGAVGLVLAAPVLALVHSSISDPSSLVVRGDLDATVREFLLAHNAVDPRAFILPGGFQSVDLAANGEAFLHSSYLGLVALALAAVTLRARPGAARLLAGVLPAAVLSLGAYVWWGDGWVVLPGFGRIALPFAWLVQVLPDAGSTHAQRLGWPVFAVVATLAALGAEHLAKGRPAVLVGLAALLAADLLASAPWPLARADALDLRAHLRLADLARTERAAAPPGNPPALGVLDLPAEVGATMATSIYLLYQSASGLPIPYRPDARGGTAAIYGTQAFNALFYPSSTRAHETEALARQFSGSARIDLGQLEAKGRIRWVVLHRELERGRGDIPQLEAQLRAWYGEPSELGTHLTWDVKARRDDGGTVLPLTAATPR